MPQVMRKRVIHAREKTPNSMGASSLKKVTPMIATAREGFDNYYFIVASIIIELSAVGR